MNYFNDEKRIKVLLGRDISKHLKQGNPWVFSDVIAEKQKVAEGTYATLHNHRKEILAHGFYTPKINLAFRVTNLGDKKFTDRDVETRLNRALENKKHLYRNDNTSLRLLNGEGDDLPGVVCDIYDQIAVLKLDGEASENFWCAKGLADFLLQQKIIPLKCVYQKRRNNEEEKGLILSGEYPDLTQVNFLEHGVKFQTNLVDAAKTGFFIDQRENRHFIGTIAKGKTLLNLFGYTGGFSIYAGLGGATHVTTVDIAVPAIEAAKLNWKLNNLPESKHSALAEDAFLYVKNAYNEKKVFDIVITDPPSFAPNHKAVESAKKAYVDIFADSLKLVKDGGHFVASSCSGHINSELFLELCQEALSRTRRRGKILLISGQPEDHPFPFALPEMRYLKFVYMQVFKD